MWHVLKETKCSSSCPCAASKIIKAIQAIQAYISINVVPIKNQPSFCNACAKTSTYIRHKFVTEKSFFGIFLAKVNTWN